MFKRINKNDLQMACIIVYCITVESLYDMTGHIELHRQKKLIYSICIQFISIYKLNLTTFSYSTDSFFKKSCLHSGAIFVFVFPRNVFFRIWLQGASLSCHFLKWSWVIFLQAFWTFILGFFCPLLFWVAPFVISSLLQKSHEFCSFFSVLPKKKWPGKNCCKKAEIVVVVYH